MKHSIVTWHEWPENGVEGLPEGKPLVVMTNCGSIGHQHLWKMNGQLFVTSTGAPAIVESINHITHYALASDLDTVHEIDGDKCSILPRALIDRARAAHSPKSVSGTSPDEDRVRWLAEQAVILSALGGLSEPNDAIQSVLAFELDAIRQVKEERERKEARP